MQPRPEQLFLPKLDQFIQLSKKATSKTEVESLSHELTAYTKQTWFFPLAHQLLTTPHALANDKKDKEVLLSSLLKDKFKYEFESLAAGNVEVCYRQLCEIARTLQHSSYGAYTNVSLALAYTYLHLLAGGPSSLDAFLTPFLPLTADSLKLYNIYFKTLEYIATEVDNTKFVMDEIQRENARSQVIAQQLAVLQSLNQNGGHAFEIPEINKENILFCFQAWITVHYDPNVLNSISNHVLFHKVLQHIRDDDCSDAAGNCLRSIIYQLKDSQQNASIYETLSTCTMEILALVDHSLKNLELDKAEDFMRIIADFSRKSTKLFISKYDRNIEAYLRQLIDYLQDELMNTYQNLGDFFEEFLHALKDTPNPNPAIFQLLDPLYCALCSKCQLPLRIIKELNQTEESKAHHISTAAEELFRNREFTEDLFELLSTLQGKEHYLLSVMTKIQGLTPTDEKQFWPYLEVYLYSLTDALREYPALDGSMVNLVRMYLQLATQSNPIPVCVRRSFLRVFRAVLCSLKELEFVYRIMCSAVSCFEDPLLVGVAEKTFCRACEENKPNAAAIFKEFSQVLEKYPQRQYIVKGLMTLLCCDNALIQQYLHPALTFLFKKYQDEPDKSRRKDYMHSLVAAIKAFKESPLAPQHTALLQQFAKDVWPAVKQVLAVPLKPKDDEDSDIERMVRILKVLMRALGFAFSELLEQLFTVVLSAFQKYPICSYVYLVEVAVTIYSADPAYNDYLRRLYSDFCEIAFQHMQKIENISRFSYLLDDFMGMNKRFFLHNASVLLSSGKLPSIIELCITAFMGCDTPRVAKAAYSFFETIFIVYWPPEFLALRNQDEDVVKFHPHPQDAHNYVALKTFLVQKLEQIVGKMLQHLANAPTEQTRDYILDALLSEIKAFLQENPEVWRGLLVGVPSEILVQAEKERMNALLESLKLSAFENAKGVVKTLDRMLVLMNQRMVNADNRKSIYY